MNDIEKLKVLQNNVKVMRKRVGVSRPWTPETIEHAESELEDLQSLYNEKLAKLQEKKHVQGIENRAESKTTQYTVYCYTCRSNPVGNPNADCEDCKKKKNLGIIPRRSRSEYNYGRTNCSVCDTYFQKQSGKDHTCRICRERQKCEAEGREFDLDEFMASERKQNGKELLERARQQEEAAKKRKARMGDKKNKNSKLANLKNGTVRTNEEIIGIAKKIKVLREDGKSYKECCDEVGIPAGSYAGIMKRYKKITNKTFRTEEEKGRIVAKIIRMNQEDGLSIVKACKKLGIAESQYYAWKGKFEQKFSEEPGQPKTELLEKAAEDQRLKVIKVPLQSEVDNVALSDVMKFIQSSSVSTLASLSGEITSQLVRKTKSIDEIRSKVTAIQEKLEAFE